MTGANTRMKHLRYITSALLLLVFSGLFIACDSSNELNVTTYCQPAPLYKLNGSDTSNALALSDLTGDTCPLNSYSVIQINTNRSWTYGLTVEKISFDIILSEASNIDIDITISNLENGANYNETADTYFFHKTLSITQPTTSITLDINDTFINKDATFSFEVVKSAYSSNSNMKLAIRNFKMFGEHKEANY